MKKHFLILFVIFTQAFSLLLQHNVHAQDASEAPSAFGYTWETGLSYAAYWVDIQAAGTLIDFSSRDDGYTYVPISIGFDFPYFENTYSTVSISTNGFLSFTVLNESFPGNRSIPRDYLPNDIVAPFWDDLKIQEEERDQDGNIIFPEGKVYYQTLGAAPDRSLVIEYCQVTRLGAGELLTFEVILHENGDFVFAYSELNGTLNTATVGFEDDAGVDGYQHIYNQAGLSNQQVMRANYPPDGGRLKAFPRYVSGFAENFEVVLPFTVRNTGTLTEGYYFNCTRVGGDPGNQWIPTFENANGQPIGSISSLSPGQDYPMQVRLKAPLNASPGDYYRARISVTASSSTKVFDIYAQGTVPAPFSQSFIENRDAYVQFVTPTRNLTRKIFETFTGSTVNLLHVAGMDYLLAWELSKGQPHQYVNIETVPFRATNNAFLDPQPLQDHTNDTEDISDRNPAMAQAPGGQNGVVFVRTRQSGMNYQVNILFGLLNEQGQLISEPVNLTNNVDWQSNDRRYRNPKLISTSNGFVAVWEKTAPNGEEDLFWDIQLAVLDNEGVLTYGPEVITDSEGLARDYTNPIPIYLSSNRLVIGYFMQPNGGQVSVGYALRQTNGGAIGTLSEIPGYSSKETGNLTIAPLASGNWLAAWVNSQDENVLFATLDDSGGMIINPTPLVALDMRAPENIASTRDEYGHVILTWSDVASEYLYYTLIDANGAVLTPPMSYKRGINIMKHNTGGGLSTCPELLIWTVTLPVIRR